jgi:uncharacterized protein YbbC (DUF1343 family)
MKFITILLFFSVIFEEGKCSLKFPKFTPRTKTLQTGAAQINRYLPDLQGKKVALVVNHTSTIGKTHLADSLRALQINIKTIFAPEHGFRGTADAGEHVANGVDKKTGIPLVSLYGKNKKPTAEQLKDIDIVVFDIQDVGTRFYTYTSTMHYVMEACAEQKKPLLILDRPNPNGHLVDGPVMQPNFVSFVGLNPVPVAHGCTVGELAEMINGEGWLKEGKKCQLKVIPCLNYTHSQEYILPIAPSPNLPNQQSIWLYASLCFFEGTEISVGRGTDQQFQVIGGPAAAYGPYQFTPVSKPGAQSPPNKDVLCYGQDLTQVNAKSLGFSLQYLVDFYQKSPHKEKFFTSPAFFDKLMGTDKIRKMIVEGKSEDEIRASWQPELTGYKKIREKYLLYGE